MLEDGWRVHARESQTILGVDCLFWALLVNLALVLSTLVVSILVVPAFFSAMKEGRDPRSLSPQVQFITLVLCLTILCGLGMAVLFLAGFHDILAGHGEFGPVQEFRATRAFRCLLLTIGLYLVLFALPRSAWMVVGLPNDIAMGPPWAVAARVPLSALFALFAGLTVLNSVYAIANVGQRSRLAIAVALGVMAASVGSTIRAIGIVSGDVDLITTAIVSGAVAGEGTTAISLLLFLQVFREIRHDYDVGLVQPQTLRPSESFGDIHEPPIGA